MLTVADDPRYCPHCTADLQGKPIPEESRKHYGTTTHFRRGIVVEIRGVYDGGLFIMCPDCGGKWHRWPKGHPLREQAAVFVDDPDWGLRKGE